eukprot:scaffold4502_cov119-Isochrysis_galbana.AAC.11
MGEHRGADNVPGGKRGVKRTRCHPPRVQTTAACGSVPLARVPARTGGPLAGRSGRAQTLSAGKQALA